MAEETAAVRDYGDPDSKELGRSQEEHREGPCLDAYETGEVVGVTDMRRVSAR